MMLAGYQSAGASPVVAHPGALTVHADPNYPHWTHDQNFETENGDDPADDVCGSYGFPCLYWPQPSGHSATEYVYINPNMYCGGCYDWRPSIEDEFVAFNSVSANNPFFYACYTSGCGAVTASMGPVDCDSAGAEDNGTYTLQYSSSLQQYYGVFSHPTITMNSDPRIQWDTTMINNAYCDQSGTYTIGRLDSRLNLGHEVGHAQGLGHTYYTNSSGYGVELMYPGADDGCGCYTPQAGDVAGLQAIYPGYYPNNSTGVIAY